MYHKQHIKMAIPLNIYSTGCFETFIEYYIPLLRELNCFLNDMLLERIAVMNKLAAVTTYTSLIPTE